MRSKKTKFYSLDRILALNAHYNVIIGERSNGKTYAALKYGVEQYAKKGSQIAIIRRWDFDFKGKNAPSLFNALVSNGEIAKATNGQWTDVCYKGRAWYLCRYEGNGTSKTRETDPIPLAYAFAITGMEHDKSTAYPDVRTIIFDEFLTRTTYVNDEFVLFMNVLSTIIRHRRDVKIFMLGNTVNKYCPYFSEMGLKHVKEQKAGTIDVYHYGESDLTVAVEFVAPNEEGKESDVYFSFDNPRLNMITGKGDIWEISAYPHKPVKFLPKDIVFTYFIIFDGEVLQCEIVSVDNMLFTFIHRKTTELKHPDEDLIYSPDYDPRPNWRRRLTVPTTPIEKKIAAFYRTDKVFYQDNDVGDLVKNYLIWSSTSTD